MTQKKRVTIGRETVRLTTSKTITMFISMVTCMLLSRFRTFQEYGTYSQMLLVVNFFTALLMLGLPTSINYFLARADTRKERKNFLSVYYTLSTILSMIIGFVLVLLIPFIEKYFNNSLISRFYYFLALYPWASIISSSIENVLVVFKKTAFLMIYRIINSVAMLSIVFIVQWLGYGFNTYIIVFVIINSIFGMSVYIIASRLSGGLTISFDKKMIRDLFAFSIPMGLATVVGTLNIEFDKFFIGYFVSTEQMAIYTNASKELPLSIIAISITAVLLPQLTRMIKNNKIEKAIELWGYATEVALIIIVFIVFVVFAFAEDAMTVLYSSKYLPGVSVFRIYILVLLLRVTYFGIVLNAYGQTKKILYCSIVSFALNVIISPIFYFIFGIEGPAIATFLAIGIVQWVQLMLTSKITKISFFRIFPWKKTIFVFLVNSLLFLVFYIIKKFLLFKFIGGMLSTFLLCIIWTLLYFVLMRKELHRAWYNLNKETD